MAKLWVIQVHNGVTHSNPHDLLRKEKKVKNKRSEKKEVVAQSSNQQQELITNVSTGRAATCRVGISGQPSDSLKKLLLYIKKKYERSCEMLLDRMKLNSLAESLIRFLLVFPTGLSVKP